MLRKIFFTIITVAMLWLVLVEMMKRGNGLANVQGLIVMKLQMLINELKSNLHLHPHLNSEH